MVHNITVTYGSNCNGKLLIAQVVVMEIDYAMIVMVMIIGSWNIQVIVMVIDFIQAVIATTLVYICEWVCTHVSVCVHL